MQLIALKLAFEVKPADFTFFTESLSIFLRDSALGW
jgi:hypothetical protein